MGIYDPTASDADYSANDEGNWSGFKPFLAFAQGSHIATWPTFPPRATGTIAVRSTMTGTITFSGGKNFFKLPLIKAFGSDDYTGKGNGGEHRFKMRVQHSLANLKLIEDIAGIEILALTKAHDGDVMCFGHKDFPAKIDRNSIKGSKGELTGESGGRYIEFEVVSFPYSAFLWGATTGGPAYLAD